MYTENIYALNSILEQVRSLKYRSQHFYPIQFSVFGFLLLVGLKAWRREEDDVRLQVRLVQDLGGGRLKVEDADLAGVDHRSGKTNPKR